MESSPFVREHNSSDERKGSPAHLNSSFEGDQVPSSFFSQQPFRRDIVGSGADFDTNGSGVHLLGSLVGDMDAAMVSGPLPDSHANQSSLATSHFWSNDTGKISEGGERDAGAVQSSGSYKVTTGMFRALDSFAATGGNPSGFARPLPSSSVETEQRKSELGVLLEPRSRARSISENQDAPALFQESGEQRRGVNDSCFDFRPEDMNASDSAFLRKQQLVLQSHADHYQRLLGFLPDKIARKMAMGVCRYWPNCMRSYDDCWFYHPDDNMLPTAPPKSRTRGGNSYFAKSPSIVSSVAGRSATESEEGHLSNRERQLMSVDEGHALGDSDNVSIGSGSSALFLPEKGAHPRSSVEAGREGLIPWRAKDNVGVSQAGQLGARFLEDEAASTRRAAKEKSKRPRRRKARGAESRDTFQLDEKSFPTLEPASKAGPGIDGVEENAHASTTLTEFHLGPSHGSPPARSRSAAIDQSAADASDVSDGGVRRTDAPREGKGAPKSVVKMEPTSATADAVEGRTFFVSESVSDTRVASLLNSDIAEAPAGRQKRAARRRRKRKDVGNGHQAASAGGGSSGLEAQKVENEATAETVSALSGVVRDLRIESEDRSVPVASRTRPVKKRGLEMRSGGQQASDNDADEALVGRSQIGSGVSRPLLCFTKPDGRWHDTYLPDYRQMSKRYGLLPALMRLVAHLISVLMFCVLLFVRLVLRVCLLLLVVNLRACRVLFGSMHAILSYVACLGAPHAFRYANSRALSYTAVSIFLLGYFLLPHSDPRRHIPIRLRFGLGVATSLTIPIAALLNHNLASKFGQMTQTCRLVVAFCLFHLGTLDLFKPEFIVSLAVQAGVCNLWGDHMVARWAVFTAGIGVTAWNRKKAATERNG